ncbi:hypothetical protein V490_08861 [Pseudogymnoascus sp. VKM F-3557]|nr:hypothetical protein V490_08861 [Pseudogymnoascus sp. VKM F-3557]
MADVELAPQSPEAGEETQTITLSHHNTPRSLHLPLSATISDLSTAVEETLSVPAKNQKFMIPKLGLLKPPFKDPALPVSSFAAAAKITLMGATTTELQSLNEARAVAARTFTRPKQRQTAHAYKTHDWKREQEESQYTFATLRPLPYLPNPSRSLAFLQRLKEDPGIKASMRRHKFSVPLLTEMNPVEHTTASMDGVSRTLGLNRNRGEVIELRLRTDAYDGYRDYKTIRRTLCHELAHNVWGDHDRNFWNLCHEIEKEVEKADWKSGGNMVGNEEYYEGSGGGFGEEEAEDEGGWTGGEFVLGAATGTEGVGGPARGEAGLSRREVLARAAEERIKRQREQEQGGEGSSSRP